MRWLCKRNEAIPRLGLVLFLAALFWAECCGSGVAAAAQISDNDLIALLSLSLGGRDLASAAWANMNSFERQTLHDEALQIASMAEAAKREGILASSDVELAVRWGTDALLAEAWGKKIESELDPSEEALRSFYEANLSRYVEPASVRYREAVYPPKQKDVALRVKTQLKKAPLSRLKNCVTVDWTPYDRLEPVWAGALRDAPLNKVMGPVETSKGHVLYEVLERRGEGPTPFEKCKNRVIEDRIQIAIKEKLP